MNTGFLFWFDNTPKRSLQDKVVEAALYYRRKFDLVPTLCLVNPNELPSDPTDETIPLSLIEAPDAITITVRPWKSVLPNHLWIGFEEMPTTETEK